MSKNKILLAFLMSMLFTNSPLLIIYLGRENMSVVTMKAAITEWTPVAEDGNARAQYNLGWMHANGKGTAQDFK